MPSPTPPHTVRGVPAGIHLEDGFSSKFAFAVNPTVSLWEIETKPPGVDGGDAIDITTHHNVALRTRAPRQLKSLTETTHKCAYDPQVITQLLSIVNKPGGITQYFPDGSSEDYFGYVRLVEFDPLVEGTFPTATVTVTPTNRDPVTRQEALPVVTAVLGT